MASAVALARQLKTVRQKTRVHAESAERRLAIGAVGATYGYLERRGTIPVAVGNIPSKLVAGVVLSIAETQLSGAARRLCGAGADGMFALYGYAAGKAGGFIAGGDDLEDEL